MLRTRTYTVLSRYLATAWFAVLTVCGHSFHDHGPEHGHDHGHAACGHHASLHAHDAENQASATGIAFHDPEGPCHGLAHDTEACAICAFRAHAQHPIGLVAVSRLAIASPAQPWYRSCHVAAKVPHCFDTRGPPRSLLTA
jgi:hypothetical protein